MLLKIFNKSKETKNDKRKKKKSKPVKVRYELRYILGRISFFLSSLFKSILKLSWRFILFLTIVILLFGTIAFIFGGYFYLSTVEEVPKLEDPNLLALPQDSVIYDVDGEKIGTVTTQRRYLVSDNEISPNIKNAVVAIEDERYFNHMGIDFIGIGRAVWVNYNSWKNGGSPNKQGASTITQQYARMVYLNQDDTLKRKFKEITLAIQLEARLSKSDILTKYLNTYYFGNGNYGVEAASRYYFNKSAADVNVIEAAMLASIINSPSLYDPTTEEGLEATVNRSYLVLNKLYELGYITRQELREYKDEDFASYLNITPPSRNIIQPYYYDFIMAELLKKYEKEEIYTGGWEIYTTLSIEKGNLMRDIALAEVGSKSPAVAMTDINPKTGAINAFLGGYDYNTSNFNLATQGKRQPGSSFKPFVLATAFKQGMRNNTPFSNSPLNITMPDGKVWNVVPDSNAKTLEQGIAYSDNAMFARLIMNTGVTPVVETAHELGIKSEINNDYAIALGGLTYGVSTLEMSSAYSSFANSGEYNEPYAIEEIKSFYGDTIYKNQLNPKKAVNSEIAAMMNLSLSNVVEYGTASNSITVDGNRAVAGKTGTTDDHADTWFVGYTPNFCAAVWMGNPSARTPINNIKGIRAWGGTFTAQIWDKYARVILDDMPKEDFEDPKGVVEVPTINEVDSLSELKKILNKLGLRYNIVEISDDTLPEDTVLEIEKAGELVPLNSTVDIKIVAHTFEVPNFAGMTPYEAVNTVKDKFSLNFEVEVDDSISPEQSGRVFNQNITPGRELKKGSFITLLLKFQTPEPKIITKEVPVPYIPTDSELAALKNQITSLESEITELTMKNTSLTEKLEVEKNKFSLVTPNFIGMDITTASILAKSMGYELTIEDNRGKVTAQIPAAGTIPLNGKITLTGEKNPVPTP